MKKLLIIPCLTAVGIAGMAAAWTSGTQAPPRSEGHQRFDELRNVPGTPALRQYSKKISPSTAVFPAPENSGFPVVYANMVYDSSWLDITEYEKVPFGIYSF